MKIIYAFLCSLCILLDTNAQQYPPEWSRYTNDGYIYDVQSDNNSNNLSEADFKNYLLNIARTNLAKQIQVQVQDFAELNKLSKDGRTSIIYSANTSFSTDVNLKLVETKTIYNSSSKYGYAIAYINRDVARNYYKNELMFIYNRINNSVVMSENFIDTGFKAKAKLELESSLKQFALIEEPLLRMNVFGVSQAELSEWVERFNVEERTIRQMLADLKHATSIYLSCSVDLFGKPYPALQNELKGLLAADGCNITNNPANADWSITISCKARKYSTVNFGNSKSYFSYVDAHITVDKIVTSQRIYEDEISAKGGHTFSYLEAAKDGCKDLSREITKIIKNYIE